MNAQEQLKKLNELNTRGHVLDKAVAGMKGDIADIKLKAMTNDKNYWRSEAMKLRARLQESQNKVSELLGDIRDYCDVTEYDGEGAESRQLRRHVWNDEDTEEQIRLEGYQE